MRLRKIILAVKCKTAHMPQEFEIILILMISTNLLHCSSYEHSVDESATLTAIESCPIAEGKSVVQGHQEEPVNTCSDVLPEMVSRTCKEHKKMLQETIQKDFKELMKGKS